MTQNRHLFLLVSGLLFFAPFHLTSAAELLHHQTESAKVEWSYEGKTGPEYWGSLDPTYQKCAKGVSQSPINMEMTKTVKLLDQQSPVLVDIISKVSLKNDGHSIIASLEPKKPFLSIGNQSFTLSQFHFHSPSEHQINSQTYDLEIHFVTKDKEGNVAVVGVFVETGNENRELAKIWNSMPTEKTDQPILLTKEINLKRLFPTKQDLYMYSGSLTIPPCTEGVQWLLIKEPIEVSKDQLNKWKENFGKNNRPIQPINNRPIYMN